MELTPAPDLETCPKCGWDGRDREDEDESIFDDVWSGPTYVPTTTIGDNLQAIIKAVPEHLRWECTRCDYPVRMPCLSESAQITGH